MVLDHWADYGSGPVYWTSSPDCSHVFYGGPRPVQLSDGPVWTLVLMVQSVGDRHLVYGKVPTYLRSECRNWP